MVGARWCKHRALAASDLRATCRIELSLLSLTLELEVEDTVTLDERRFDQLVMDNWGWKASFTASNTPYLAS